MLLVSSVFRFFKFGNHYYFDDKQIFLNLEAISVEVRIFEPGNDLHCWQNSSKTGQLHSMPAM
jgi:hypothetical protein